MTKQFGFLKASGIGKVELQLRHVEAGGGLEGRKDALKGTFARRKGKIPIATSSVIMACT